jgi:hypothetical protein
MPSHATKWTSDPRRFVIVGVVTAWDPRRGALQIGQTTLWVAPGVSVTGVASGARVTAVGHHGARRVVTKLTLQPLKDDVGAISQ